MTKAELQQKFDELQKEYNKLIAENNQLYSELQKYKEMHLATIDIEKTSAYQSLIKEVARLEDRTKQYQESLFREQRKNAALVDRCILAESSKAGRKKNNAWMQQRNEQFSELYEMQKSQTEIMQIMGMSSATYFRFLKRYREQYQV